MKTGTHSAKPTRLVSDKTKKVNKTREMILDKAEELFANHGMGAFSLRKIAAQAQVEPTLITYHVGNKDALLEAVVERRMAVPHLADEELFWGLMLVHGSALLLFSNSPRLEQVASHCSTTAQNIEKGYATFIQNASRGLRPPH